MCKDKRKTRVTRKIELNLPIKPISTNQLYGGIKRRSGHYKKFRRDMFKLLSCYSKENISLTGNLGMKMTVGVSSSLSDLSNVIKGAEDVLAEWLGFNDRQIVYIELHKTLVRRGDEYINVTIYRTNKQIDMRK